MSDKKILSFWGMPGAGKSYWGKLIAEELSVDFIDLDESIQTSQGLKISEIVINKGEPYFRKKESEALSNVINDYNSVVLSLGGGTPCNEQNLSLLKSHCLNIWLNPDISKILENLSKVANNRPLIDPKSDLRVQMELLLERRIKYYKRADLIIEQPFSIQSILNLIPDSFKNTIRR